MKCNICEEKIIGKKYKCYSCKLNGCNQCIDTACCDCSVIMCKDCRTSGKPNCGCYGNCNSCGKSVDRGSDGWPCQKCKKWLCNDCKYNTKCNVCKNKL